MAASSEPTTLDETAASPALAVAPPPQADRVDQSAIDAAQVQAEGNLVRSVLTGMAIGAFVCSAIWIGLVSLATVGAGVRLVPMLAVAAACGAFAGIFLGGCAGALAGARGLEHVEHERMHGPA
jgi:hypothetical protein